MPTIRITPRTAFSAGIAAALLLTSAAPALALDARVRVSDLDVTRPAHAATLEARITAAADRLCRNARRPGSFVSDRAWCEAQVRAEVTSRLPDAPQRHPALTRNAR